VTFLGLTWDHPRGRDALEEAARRANAGRPEPLLDWAVQPLEGFESAPIAELAARHDLLVIDHPHIGEAAAEGCLRPLDELFPAGALAAWARGSVGPSFASYVWGGRPWALPLDVATQVMARRPDIVAAPPADWDEVEALARRRPVALSIGGPHAVLTLMSVAAGQGSEARGEEFLPDDAFARAFGVLRRLWPLRPDGSERLNPIALCEAMGRGEIALVPLVFGYVTYARAATGRAPLAFSDAIGGRGGTLGGTGIAVTRRSRPSDELLAHLAWLLSPAAQLELFPAFGGQPSARAAWTDRAVNAAWGGFYRATLATAEQAYLRPRFDGYIAFQTAASARLRDALAQGEDDTVALAALRALWRGARARARGDLDDRRSP
jgi:multiple sugar transport system substrate-binding protein